jgi:hypothetical protein
VGGLGPTELTSMKLDGNKKYRNIKLSKYHLFSVCTAHKSLCAVVRCSVASLLPKITRKFKFSGKFASFFIVPSHALLTVSKQQQDRNRPTKNSKEVCVSRQIFLCALVQNVEKLIRNRMMRKQACPGSA